MANQITATEIKIGSIGVIQKSKHAWNNGVHVKVKEICGDDLHVISLVPDSSAPRYILGRKNFRFIK